MKIPETPWRKMSTYEQNAVALALANKQPWRVAELLGKIKPNALVDDVYDAQIKKPR